MSHLANDIVADNKMDRELDRAEYWREQEEAFNDRMEDVYDDSYEPTCGLSTPFWEN